MVRQRHFLGAQVLLHGHRVVGATLDRRVVGDDDALTSADATDAGDDARSGRLVAVHLIGGQRREFEKGTAAIEQGVDAVSWQEFAPLDVSLARRLGAARVVIQSALELFYESEQLGPLRAKVSS